MTISGPVSYSTEMQNTLLMNIISRVEIVYLAVPVVLVILVSGLLVLEVSTVESRAGLLLSGVTIFLLVVLVWERVREAVVLRLDFVSRIALAPVAKISWQGPQRVHSDGAKVLDDSQHTLSRYGRFLLIKLYPKNMMGLLRRSIIAIDEYSKVREQVSELGRRSLGAEYCIGCLLQAAGFPADECSQRSKIERNREFLASLRDNEAGLSEQFTRLTKELSANLTSLSLIIETFFDQNLAEISSVALSFEERNVGV